MGIVLLALAAVGLFVWKKNTTPTETTQTVTAPVATSIAPTTPPPLYAPPPPPKIEEEPDAGADAGAQPAAKGTGGTGGSVQGACGSKCNGQASGALSAALRSTAQSAQGCYNRALRTSEASGRLVVSVQVAQNGSVCGASVAEDTVHSGDISTCVINRFRGKSFPPPDGGCITVNIPISFSIKQ